MTQDDATLPLARRRRCQYRGRTACYQEATHRVYAGTDEGGGYAGGWYLCEEHLPRLIEETVAMVRSQGLVGWTISVYAVETLHDEDGSRYARTGRCIGRMKVHVTSPG